MKKIWKKLKKREKEKRTRKKYILENELQKSQMAKNTIYFR